MFLRSSIPWQPHCKCLNLCKNTLQSNCVTSRIELANISTVLVFFLKLFNFYTVELSSFSTCHEVYGLLSTRLWYHHTTRCPLQWIYFSNQITCLHFFSESGFPNDIHTYGLLSGIWSSSFALGAFLGPTIAGILYDWVGFELGTLFEIGLHIGLVSTATLWWTRIHVKTALVNYLI